MPSHFERSVAEKKALNRVHPALLPKPAAAGPAAAAGRRNSLVKTGRRNSVERIGRSLDCLD